MSLYVIDTSALVSLGLSRVFQTVTDRLDLHTTKVVVDELEEMTEIDDAFANSAELGLEAIQESEQIIEHSPPISKRDLHPTIDRGEASCIDLVQELEADYLVTDDHRASNALKQYVGDKIVFSPILLKALSNKGLLSEQEAVNELQIIAEGRNWFNSPLYAYALDLFG